MAAGGLWGPQEGRGRPDAHSRVRQQQESGFWTLYGVRAPQPLLLSINPSSTCLSQPSPFFSVAVSFTNPPQDCYELLCRT